MEISWDCEGVDVWNWITTKELGASLKIVDPAKIKMIEANYEKLIVQLCSYSTDQMKKVTKNTWEFVFRKGYY